VDCLKAYFIATSLIANEQSNHFTAKLMMVNDLKGKTEDSQLTPGRGCSKAG